MVGVRLLRWKTIEDMTMIIDMIIIEGKTQPP